MLDALDAGPQPAVGHSLGGLTAVALIAAGPELVGIVLVDASPGLRIGAARQVSELLAGPQVLGSREEIVGTAIAARIGSDREGITRGVALHTRIRDDGTVVRSHHPASPPQHAEQLPGISTPWTGLTDTDVPVLLVHAARGFLNDGVAAEFRDRVPGAAVVQLDTGHTVREQDPAGLTAAITAFAGRALRRRSVTGRAGPGVGTRAATDRLAR